MKIKIATLRKIKSYVEGVNEAIVEKIEICKKRIQISMNEMNIADEYKTFLCSGRIAARAKKIQQKNEQRESVLSIIEDLCFAIDAAEHNQADEIDFIHIAKIFTYAEGKDHKFISDLFEEVENFVDQQQPKGNR